MTPEEIAAALARFKSAYEYGDDLWEIAEELWPEEEDDR